MLLLAMLVSSCASTPNIYSDFNASVNFQSYKSFGFFEKLDTDHRYESLVSQYLKDATIAEMTKRGFIFTEHNSDLLINFHTNVEQKQRVHEIPIVDRAGYYAYRSHRSYYDVWPSYEIYIENYEEGTLNIDMVERKSNAMVWEGIAVGRLSKEKKQNIQSTIEKAVIEIYSQFPISVPMEKNK